MQRANDESESKSNRISKSWTKKKKDALATGKPMTRKSPHWIHADKDRVFTLIPERVEVLHKMLDMAERGVGNHTIIKTLHAEGIPAWSSSGKWEPSYVQKVMHSPALYGGMDIDGEIIQMYPPVIEKARFDYISALRSNRATTKNTNRKGLGVTNLFSGLLKCGYCGSAMNISGYKERRSGYERKYVACHGARTGKTACKMKMWFLDELEPSLLFWLTSIDYAALMNVGVQTNLQAEQIELASLEATIKDAAARVERTMIAIEEGATTMVPRLKQHEAEVDRLSKLAVAQRRKVAALLQQDGNGASRMKGLIALFKALKNTSDDVQRRVLREQLSASIASTVARIVLFPAGRNVTGEKSDRFADVFFKNGATRRIEVGEC